MDVVPVVFGSGKRYFGPVDGQHLLEDPDVVIQGAGCSICGIGFVADGSDRQLIFSGLVVARGRQVRGHDSARAVDSRPPAPLPAELVQAPVVDAEVMADLMDDGPPHLLYHFGLTVADGADRLPVDDDPIWQRPGVVRRAPGQRNTAVEPEQTRRSGVVIDRDRHVAHHPTEAGRQAVEGLGDHVLESLRLVLSCLIVRRFRCRLIGTGNAAATLIAPVGAPSSDVADAGGLNDAGVDSRLLVVTVDITEIGEQVRTFSDDLGVERACKPRTMSRPACNRSSFTHPWKYRSQLRPDARQRSRW